MGESREDATLCRAILKLFLGVVKQIVRKQIVRTVLYAFESRSRPSSTPTQFKFNSIPQRECQRASARVISKSNGKSEGARALTVYYFIKRSEHAPFPSPCNCLTSVHDDPRRCESQIAGRQKPLLPGAALPVGTSDTPNACTAVLSTNSCLETGTIRRLPQLRSKGGACGVSAYSR